MAAPTDLVSQVDLFRDLDRGELRDVAGAMKEYRFPAGREIVSEGSGGAGFFLISEGTAKVLVGGAEVRTLGPGDSFGEIALVADVPRTATVTADSDVTCWGLTSWAFRPIVEHNASVAWKLVQLLARQLTTK
jgi:CRP/FNR family transcriptional regulator